MLFKAEHLQRGGSFKARGAANALLGRDTATVVAGSSGNHGIAVAALARRTGAAATVVMAAGAGREKADAIRRLGARVVTADGGVAARDQLARRLAADTGALLVHSSDDERVIAGQGTVALEILEEAPDLDLLFVPVGGGGLLAGCCLAAGLAARPVRVIGVEPQEARRYAVSLAAGNPVELPASRTVADGLRGQRPGEITLPIVRGRVDELIAVGTTRSSGPWNCCTGPACPPNRAAAWPWPVRSGAASTGVRPWWSPAATRRPRWPPWARRRRGARPPRPVRLRRSPRPLSPSCCDARPCPLRCFRPHFSQPEGVIMTVQDQTLARDLRSVAGLTELITVLYQEALGNEGLDEHADFFESGGDSLTAFQITGRIQEAVGTEIAIALVFTYPTPAELAEVVAEELADLPGATHE